MSTDRKWLIRTKSNHILGPVSKEKVLELYSSGSIKPDDEVCSGNGYWFFIREQELVERYLFNDEIQSFNPVSEAKDLLTVPKQRPVEESPAEVNEVQDPPQSQTENTLVGQVLPDSAPEVVANAQPAPVSPPRNAPAIEKKKANPRRVNRPAASRPPRPQFKQQSYLKYLVYIFIIILILLIYYRKAVIRYLYNGETFFSSVLIPSAVAQEGQSEKKKLLERVISFDEVSFRAVAGLKGLRVTGSVDIANLACDELDNEVYQMAVILHPPEAFNERFLVKMRNCVSLMGPEHPVRRWFEWASESKALRRKDQLEIDFLSEIVNSPFNLITDSQLRTGIIEIISTVPEHTIGERLLKAYLYMMIGNITRADNILLSTVNQAPFENWKGYRTSSSIYHQLATENAGRIFNKFYRHPTDRRTFELFTRYMRTFFNDPSLMEVVNANTPSVLGSRLYLEHTGRISSSFVAFLRLSGLPDALRFQLMRNVVEFPLRQQAYWFWPFFEIDPLVTNSYVEVLEWLDSSDELWFIYIMDNERLAELYIQATGKSFLPNRRQQLRKMLRERDLFMLALFKLIEFGDIDQSLVNETLNFLLND
jgi:hypothetical protein